MRWRLPRSQPDPAGSGRVRTPTILQMESAECGAAALAMVLAFHGRWLPLEELRAACGVSRDGCKASNILRAARNHGLSAQGMRLDREALSGQAMPAILFWQFNHFLVLEGFRRGHAWVNDPACGRRKLGLEEFDRCYTGIALCFAPGPGFQRGGVPRSMRAALLPRLRGVGRPLSFVLLASLALVAPGLALPVFAQVFVDAYLVENLEGWLRPLLLGMAVTALLRGLLTWLQQLHLLRLETQLALAGSAAFVWHVLRLPVTFFSQRFAGDIAQRVDSNNRVALLLSGDLSTNAAGLLMLGFYALVMFAYDWQLTLVCLVLTSLNVLLLLRVARMRKDASLYLQQERGKLLATVAGGIQTMETIKASGAEQDFFQRWCGQYVKTFNVSQELQLQARMLAAVPLLISGLITAAILGLGGVRVMEGSLSVGMLVAFQSLVASFFQPVRNLMTLAGKAQEAQADLVRLDDVLRYPVDPAFGAAADEAGAAAIPEASTDASIDASRTGARLQGWLELRNLRFGYSRLEPPLIDGFSLRLAPGQRVALVGASGSGKSTIARIVLGLHQPWSGQVLFDGQPRAHWPALLMCASLGAVDQEPVLFQGSVRDNLSLWDATLPETDMVRAAHDAMIHEAIAERPEGYDSLIAEGGANFSGGQRQRLEIARALAGNPSILVLDEATSALDPATEKMIDERLRRRGCTCLIVAHRLSTIRDCDEIIVMDGGRILERGTHDTLLSRPGAYRRLIGEIAA